MEKIEYLLKIGPDAIYIDKGDTIMIINRENINMIMIKDMKATIVINSQDKLNLDINKSHIEDFKKMFNLI